MSQIFADAKAVIGSELFDHVIIDKIPSAVISGVIKDLYHVFGLPSNSRYNFGWIDADVLGLAYEKYLSTILQPITARPQLDLFNTVERDVNRVSVRRAKGVFYTPPFLTKYLASRCIDVFYNTRSGADLPKIVDFACGSGSFLVAAFDALLPRLKKISPSTDWARKLVEEGFLVGVDADEKAVTVARLNLWNRLTDEPNPLPLPNLSRVIIHGDGLDAQTWSPLPKTADIVLGNPPFIATSRIGSRETLETRFETARGRFDYSSLFVEQAINVTSAKGIIGLVVPNRLFRSYNGANRYHR